MARYSIAKRVVSLAPELAEWEFYPAKPRKIWRRRFRWSDRGEEIDAGGWRFVVYRDPSDGKYQLVLLGDVLVGIPEAEQRGIAIFVVEVELGEALFLERLFGLDVERQPTAEDQDNSIPITDLFQVVISGSPIT